MSTWVGGWVGQTPGKNMGPDRKRHLTPIPLEADPPKADQTPRGQTPWKEHGTRQEVIHPSSPELNSR